MPEENANCSLRNSMISLVCDQPSVTEAFYTKHFGFRRARVYLPGPNQVVVLKARNAYLQIFPAFEQRPRCLESPSQVTSPYPGGAGAGPLFTGVRKLTFLIDDIEHQLAGMGNEARISQAMRPGLIPDSQSVWIIDPSGNVIELIEGYCDEDSPLPAPVVPTIRTLPWLQVPSVDQAVFAARRGDEAFIHEWLNSGGNPNQYDEAGWTPLLAAAVRGQSGVVKLLLSAPLRRADFEMPHARSAALAIHFAGQSGSVETTTALLKIQPAQIERIWELNGHTLLLQAVFYGHFDLTQFALERGANTAATTVRGMAAMELAGQFQNKRLMDLIAPHDSPPKEKAAYFQKLLQRITPITHPDQIAAQEVSDRLINLIDCGLAAAATQEDAMNATLRDIRDLVSTHHVDINRLGGQLQQSPLIVAVTGNNGSPPNPNVASLRKQVVAYLLEKGADPTVAERHPMAVNAMIRAAVFNHLEILDMMGRHMTAERLKEVLNEQPAVNGLTALHDTVLRATTAAPDRFDGYLAQIRWFVAHGARSDIEDFSGRTQRNIADDALEPHLRQQILEALGT
jgi:ankyrin repeat protein